MKMKVTHYPKRNLNGKRPLLNLVIKFRVGTGKYTFYLDEIKRFTSVNNKRSWLNYFIFYDEIFNNNTCLLQENN